MLRLILILGKVSLWCYQVFYLTIEIVFVMFRSISLKNQIENQKCQPVFRILCRKIPFDQKKVTWPEGTENSHMSPGVRDFPSAHKIPALVFLWVKKQKSADGFFFVALIHYITEAGLCSEFSNGQQIFYF